MDPNRELDTLRGIAGAPFVLAMVEAVKAMYPTIDRRLIPLVAILLGTLLNVSCAWYYREPLFPSVWVGVASGLIAVGAYSAAKQVAKVANASKREQSRENESMNDFTREQPG